MKTLLQFPNGEDKVTLKLDREAFDYLLQAVIEAASQSQLEEALEIHEGYGAGGSLQIIFCKEVLHSEAIEDIFDEIEDAVEEYFGEDDRFICVDFMTDIPPSLTTIAESDLFHIGISEDFFDDEEERGAISKEVGEIIKGVLEHHGYTFP